MFDVIFGGKGIEIDTYKPSNFRNHRNLSFLSLQRVVNAFIKSQYDKKRIFTHFQAKVFENLIAKNDF